MYNEKLFLFSKGSQGDSKSLIARGLNPPLVPPLKRGTRSDVAPAVVQGSDVGQAEALQGFKNPEGL